MLSKGPPAERQAALPRGSGCFLGQEKKWGFRLMRCIAASGGKMWGISLKSDGSETGASQPGISYLCLRDWERDKARLEVLHLARQASAAIKMPTSCRVGFAVGLH